MQLRSYQSGGNNQVMEAWNAGHRNVCMVMPTGAGKTATFTKLIKDVGVPTMAIAHRQELILQISTALARWGIQHRVIAPDAVIRFCNEIHIEEFGQSYTHGQDVMLSSVQTLLRREDKLRNLFGRIKMWTGDECHHFLPDNQWGKGIDLFPNVQYGLGVTATPLRCDGKGLDAVFDTMVVGPTMRDLINEGFLTDYKIYCPPVSIDLNAVRVSQSSGEYIQAELRHAAHESAIVGDVVNHWIKLLPGKRSLTFAVDRASARDMTAAYRQQGIPAAYVDGDTPDRERVKVLADLGRGDIKVVVNVDLFGEGMDCPALDGVQMARPTQSYSLFVQQFGRALRPHPNKEYATIIDHVGNVVTHGLPDRPRSWSLLGRSQRQADADMIPLSVCAACMQPRERFVKVCPFCGFVPVPGERSSPAHVDGDLIELDPEVLAQMRGEVIPLNSDPLIRHSASNAEIGRRTRDHRALVEAQHLLREAIAWYAGVEKYGNGLTDSEIHRKFYLQFGIDVMSAQALRRADAEKLTSRIKETYT